jgi:hypothetical protein
MRWLEIYLKISEKVLAYEYLEQRAVIQRTEGFIYNLTDDNPKGFWRKQ